MARSGASPAQPREGVPDGQNEHGRVLHVAGTHVNMLRGSGGGAGVHGGRRRKGAGWPHRRARGVGVEHIKEGKGGVVLLTT
jgi:hypothetical protein